MDDVPASRALPGDSCTLNSKCRVAVPWQQPHRRSGLATLPTVGAHSIIVDLGIFYVYVFIVLVYFVLIAFSGFTFVASFPSLLWYYWLGLLTCNTVSQITYTVLVETLNTAQSINQSTQCRLFHSMLSSSMSLLRSLLNYLIAPCTMAWSGSR